MMESGSADDRRLRRMEAALASLLRYGALFASAWLAAGMALGMLAEASPALLGCASLAEHCLAAGIMALIALPVLRVALTTAVFLFEGDYAFAAISGAVLLIIAAGFLLGIMSPGGGLP